MKRVSSTQPRRDELPITSIFCHATPERYAMRCPPEGCVAKSAPRQAFAMHTSASHVSSPSDRTVHGYGSGS